MRGNDILLLAQHFVGDFAAQTGKQVRGLTSAAAETLLAYSWPGNVRELRNSMERAVALTRYEQITVVDLPERTGRGAARASSHPTIRRSSSRWKRSSAVTS